MIPNFITIPIRVPIPDYNSDFFDGLRIFDVFDGIFLMVFLEIFLMACVRIFNVIWGGARIFNVIWGGQELNGFFV